MKSRRNKDIQPRSSKLRLIDVWKKNGRCDEEEAMFDNIKNVCFQIEERWYADSEQDK